MSQVPQIKEIEGSFGEILIHCLPEDAQEVHYKTRQIFIGLQFSYRFYMKGKIVLAYRIG